MPSVKPVKTGGLYFYKGTVVNITQKKSSKQSKRKTDTNTPGSYTCFMGTPAAVELDKSEDNSITSVRFSHGVLY